jgi:hypothetical protein
LFIPNDFQFQNPFITVSPGLINLALPNGKYRHPIIGDGNCLFRSICFALSGHQNQYSEYRKNAVDYIVNHSSDFKDDIYLMRKKSVTEYAQDMRKNGVYGEDIMIIALCLSLEISITVYQKDAQKLETCEYRPTFNYKQQTSNKLVEIYLDLNLKHYECILDSPPQPVHNVRSPLMANSSQDLYFSSPSAQTGFHKNNSTMTQSGIAQNLAAYEENIFIQTSSNALENSVPAVPTTPGIIRLQEFEKKLGLEFHPPCLAPNGKSKKWVIGHYPTGELMLGGNLRSRHASGNLHSASVWGFLESCVGRDVQMIGIYGMYFLPILLTTQTQKKRN